jgi:mono/diheme cytochrome c family protein
MKRIGTGALVALALFAAGCGGDDAGSATSVVSEATSAVEDATGDPTAGAQVFDDAGCRGCHTIEGEGGAVGPNLDEHDVSYPEIVEQVTTGGGGMPAFADQLSEEEIRNVSAFVDQNGP